MSQVTISIDGKVLCAEEGASLLETALNAGIYIPNLCHHPDLKPLGACRLCLVEVDGTDAPVASCETTVTDGMVVHTDTETVQRLRRLSMELMLADHPKDCSGCKRYGKCPMQSLIQYVSAGSRLRSFSNNAQENTSHPLFIRDPHRCIKCGRCVRICRDVRGVNAIDYYRNEKQEILVGAAADGDLLAKCRSCTACVEVCPTGALRDKEETFPLDGTREERLVLCRQACPAHVDAVRYLRCIREGNYAEATAVIREKVPFPAILSHICTHPCEDACRRSFVNEAVSIRNLKRFAAEHDDGEWKEKRVFRPETGKRVAVIGSGPSGLTAAYYLAKQGHSVRVYEAMPHAGGMIRYGIPEYRLPREIIEKEINEICDAGVEIKTGKKITDAKQLLEQGYDAVLLAIGTWTGTRLPMEGASLPGVMTGLDLLRSVRMDAPQKPGRRAVVLGGGPVAIDCARMARRLGAEEVHMACLEARDQMTAGPDELALGIEEGIILHPATSFVRIEGETHVEGMTLELIRDFHFDENRRAIVETVEGSAHTIPCDNVIFAVGMRPKGADSFGAELFRNAYFVTDEDGKTSVDGVFACGDCVGGASSVIRCIADGRKAARQIDRYLGGNGDITEVLAPVREADPYLGETDHFCRLLRKEQAVMPVKERLCSFACEEETFTECDALAESNRCLQCDLRTKLEPLRLFSQFLGQTEGAS